MAQENNKPEQDAGRGQKLFAEFSASSYEEWKEAAVASLKGAPFEKKVLTRTYEDIELKPLYMQQDVQDLPHLDSRPGFPPFVRGSDPAGYLIRPWDVCQELPYSRAEEFNQAAHDGLERGLTALNLVLDRATRQGIDPDQAGSGQVGCGGLSLAVLDDLQTAFKGLDLTALPIHAAAGAASLPLLAMISAWTSRQGLSPNMLRGVIGADPLGELAREGDLPLTPEAAYDLMAAAARWAIDRAPGLKTVLVAGQPYHDAGAAATQELAYTLAAGVEYLRALIDRGLTVEQAAGQMVFSFALGANFFMEIAKIRAARMLWTTIIEAFGGDPALAGMIVHGRTSSFTKASIDPYVNMLRNTTEALAGVAAGVQSLHVAHFDEPVRPPDEFSRRVSRNLQLLLQHECHLTYPIDPGGGSWYIEKLTDQAARKAWTLFQEVEESGGLFKALQLGGPQAAVEETSRERAANLSRRKDILVGVNMYPNLEEKPLKQPEVDYDQVQKQRAEEIAAYRTRSDQTLSGLGGYGPELVDRAAEACSSGITWGGLAAALGYSASGTTRVKALGFHRGSEIFEGLRQNAAEILAQTGRRPRIFLTNIGPLAQHKPRADFATGFFQVGGFEILSSDGFQEADQAARAALASGAPIVVICGTDKIYPEIVPDLTRKIKAADSKITVILAGKPAPEAEAMFQEAGLDDFIFIRSNCFEMNLKMQKKCGWLQESEAGHE